MSWLNLLIIIVIIAGVGLGLYIILRKNPYSGAEGYDVDAEHMNIDSITEFATEVINDYVNTNLLDLGLTAEEFERRKEVVADLKTALKNCNTGSLADKLYVKEFISDILSRNYGITEQNINQILPFHDEYLLTDQDKFEILLYLYKQEHGFDGLSKLIEAYDLARLKRLIEKGQTESYIITGEEIRNIYQKENPKLTFEDKFQIIVQRVYQQYKGFGPIDEIRDQTIDGVSGGVSGVPVNMNTVEHEIDMMQGMGSKVPYGYESIWMFYRGKSVHLSFLSFGSDLELRRVCQNVYKYGNPGQLSEAKSFIVNDMQDGSRVVVVRPPFAESWAFFIRKFDLPNLVLDRLLAADRVKNAHIAMQLLDYLMKGGQVTAVTGEQGSGKTTLLMAIVKSIYGTYNLRIQELAFELHLRRLYPERNILSFRETEKITGQEGLDIQKKTDGSVNILGEVATDPVAAWLVQMAQVASKFTVFSHHAKTMKDLIWSLRNSLLKTGTFQNERIAEEQVANVISFDVHLDKEQNGTRYIERITECVVIDQHGTQFSELAEKLEDENMDLRTIALANLSYYQKMTSSPWKASNILEFRDGAYIPVNRPSAKKVEDMAKNMTSKDAKAFRAFLDEYWGPEAA
ncbi:ATPase, T2SS/T4P/T4SS family [Paenibacillus gallinarum]|uniref:Flp pilus assembly complex ATPase component TadA n=1 Tax=Paenibacillus gallinarum TaxID=2762232 RepID=A0ABR8T3E0_9BACL|nr:ATPase, T2SS/T4P/T4SS family [Paenibacillus gallinarum]MBD7970293.1 Flp pilus assembly complex ATPase component TadA [Paenibacillus gallinarum]